jgi:conjugative transfer signal peptidase TraF
MTSQVRLASSLQSAIHDLRVWMWVALVFATLFVANEAWAYLVAPSLTFNVTTSMPLGYYKIFPIESPLSRGDVVSFCPSKDVVRRGLAVGIYIPPGTCQAGTVPFLKHVLAVEGDTVDARGPRILVNGSTIPDSNRITDTRVRVLMAIQPRIYRVKHGEVWVISEDPSGYDSRYYGAIAVGPATAMMGATPIPLATWKVR